MTFKESAITYPRTFLRSKTALAAEIDQLILLIRRLSQAGINIGAGDQPIQGLVNCDLHNPEADLNLDATNLYGIGDATFDLVEAHHVIEHFSFDEVGNALSEWNRILVPGGVLIITCPDLTHVCIQWLRFQLLPDNKWNRQESEYVLRMLMGSQEHRGMFHKSAFDAKRMRRILAETGFETEFVHTPYPVSRKTPSLLAIARKHS